MSQWRQRIDPLLKGEEARKTFDLQQYGEKIIVKLMDEPSEGGGGSKAEGEGKELSFGQILKGSGAVGDRFEVSRTFAALLQLINNRNVAVVRDPEVACFGGGAAGSKGGGRGGGGPSSLDLLNTRAPDAPFRLKLLTAVQPHKQMASKMAVGKAGVAAAEEHGVVAEAEGGDEVRRKIEERPRQQKKAKKAAQVEEEEGEEEEMDDVENAEEEAMSPAKKKSKTKGGEKGARAKPLGRSQLKA